MTDLGTLPVADLMARCQAQTLAYLRSKEVGDDQCCLELFRRAIQQDDQAAWAFIYTWYSTEEFLGEHYLLKWVRGWLNGRHGSAIRVYLTEEEMVQEVWLRFMRSEAARNFNFSDMGHLMAFLRRLVNNYALDVARRKGPELVEHLDDTDDSALDLLLRSLPDEHVPIEAAVVNQEAVDDLLREVVGEIIITEQEMLVFRGYFLEELPPRRLYELYPGRFAHGEVEAIRTRLSRRLRKVPYLLMRYVHLVVLEEDERRKLVFNTSLAQGWPDHRVLAMHPDLFRDGQELLDIKVHILEALNNRPLVRRFLGLGVELQS
jgi:DNA-directed RNA polymerase specialized sigma24 family protein